MTYFKLPSKTRQTVITVVVLASYVSMMWFMPTFFPDLEPDLKKKLSQIGLAVIFTSGLLAGLGFVWGSKARHNLEVAGVERRRLQDTIDILNVQASHLGISFQNQIQNAQRQLSVALQEEKKAKEFPTVLSYSGNLSLFVLAVGTLLCIVGEG